MHTELRHDISRITERIEWFNANEMVPGKCAFYTLYIQIIYNRFGSVHCKISKWIMNVSLNMHWFLAFASCNITSSWRTLWFKYINKWRKHFWPLPIVNFCAIFCWANAYAQRTQYSSAFQTVFCIVHHLDIFTLARTRNGGQRREEKKEKSICTRLFHQDPDQTNSNSMASGNTRRWWQKFQVIFMSNFP